MWNVVKLLAVAVVLYIGLSMAMGIGDAMMKASAYATSTHK